MFLFLSFIVVFIIKGRLRIGRVASLIDAVPGRDHKFTIST